MKRIINGKSYNTETATLVAHYDSPHGCTDFHHYSEGLYRTRKGAWFLAGEGGPMSKYARSLGSNSWGGGDGLEVLTAEEAQEWLERRDFVAELEEHFASSIEEA